MILKNDPVNTPKEHCGKRLFQKSIGGQSIVSQLNVLGEQVPENQFVSVNYGSHSETLESHLIRSCIDIFSQKT